MSSRALPIVTRIVRALGLVFALLVSLGGGVLGIAAGDWVVDSACCCPSPADCDCDPDHRDDASLDACGNSGHATGLELDTTPVPPPVVLAWHSPRAAVITYLHSAYAPERITRERTRPG